MVHKLVRERSIFFIILYDFIQKSERFDGEIKLHRHRPSAFLKLVEVTEDVREGKEHIEDYTDTPHIDSLVKARLESFRCYDGKCSTWSVSQALVL